MVDRQLTNKLHSQHFLIFCLCEMNVYLILNERFFAIHFQQNQSRITISEDGKVKLGDYESNIHTYTMNI